MSLTSSDRHLLQVLRMMPGYADNVLLLPTREPGESLPKELVEYYDKYCCNLTEEGDFFYPPGSFLLSFYFEFVLTLPWFCPRLSLGCVSELTPEINSGTQVLDSHNHRGPAIILYGGPMTGKVR